MIDLSVSRSVGAPRRALRIFGIGGAGANVLDRMVLDGVNASHLVAIHTASQALQACVAGQKLQIGESLTRGLGAGGDPELGRAAVEESFYELRSAVAELDAVFLLGGLGGGTASGALPVMAKLAREAGALVIAFVTIPFSFEGKRRRAQAEEALQRLKQEADAVICFENDLMGEQVSPRAGIAQAFAVADQTLSQSVRAVAALFHRKGLINLGFDDLKAALAGNRARTLFAYGEAEGTNRPYDALARALKSPLMDKGKLLRDCDTILVQVTGGPEMTLTEVELLMEEFNRKVEQRSRLLFGVAADTRSEGWMSVTLFATLAEDAEPFTATEAEAIAQEPVVSLPMKEEMAEPVHIESAVEPTTPAPAPMAASEPEPAPAPEPELTAPPIEAESEEEVVPAPRGDGLDAIFGPRVVSVSDSGVEANTAPESPDNVTSFHTSIIDEEEAAEESDLEPLVPFESLHSESDTTEPASFPSFVIEEEPESEEPKEPELEELGWEPEAEEAAPLPSAEEPLVEEEPPPVTEPENEDTIPAAPEEGAPDEEDSEENSDEEPQATLFREDGRSIFSRPLTRVARPIPGRTPGSSSPFYQEEIDSAKEEEIAVSADLPEDPIAEDSGETFETEEPVEPIQEPVQQHETDQDAPVESIVAERSVVIDDAEASEEATSAPSEEQEEPQSPLAPPEPRKGEEEATPASAISPAIPPAAPASKSSSTPSQTPSPTRAPQQETLKFESARRGRFEKSEPTIEDGQDLDIPTFLRRNIKIRP